MDLVSGAGIMPGKCFLCERAFEDDEQAVDVKQMFTPDWPHVLYGAKMVCANCAKAVAQRHGFVTQTVEEFTTQQDVIFAELDKARAERDALQAQLDEGINGIVKLVERTRRAASKTPAG